MRQRFRNKKERARRIEEAAERQATYDALTIRERIVRAESRCGLDMTRELRRLYAQLPEGESIGGVRLA